MGFIVAVLSPLLLTAMLQATDDDQVRPAVAPVYYNAMVATVDVPCTALRAEASTRQPVVHFLYQGTRAEVIQTEGDWLRVRVLSDPDVMGWMHRIQTVVGFEDIPVDPTKSDGVAVAFSD